MSIMALEAEVSTDGFVHLDLRVDLPPGLVDVVVKIQPRKNRRGQVGKLRKATKSQQELWAEFEKLTKITFQKMTWDEIKEGRREDENRY